MAGRERDRRLATPAHAADRARENGPTRGATGGRSTSFTWRTWPRVRSPSALPLTQRPPVTRDVGGRLDVLGVSLFTTQSNRRILRAVSAPANGAYAARPGRDDDAGVGSALSRSAQRQGASRWSTSKPTSLDVMPDGVAGGRRHVIGGPPTRCSVAPASLPADLATSLHRAPPREERWLIHAYPSRFHACHLSSLKTLAGVFTFRRPAATGPCHPPEATNRNACARPGAHPPYPHSRGLSHAASGKDAPVGPRSPPSAASVPL